MVRERQLHRTLLLTAVTAGSLALVVAAVALLVWAVRSGDRQANSPARAGDSVTTAGDVRRSPRTSTAAAANHATLRLGQGFRFKDGAVVLKSDDRPDVVFKYVPPQPGGVNVRYNGAKGGIETKVDATITSPIPLLASYHANAFADRPDVAHTTTGDVAAYRPDAGIGPGAKYVLLQGAEGDHYLLTLDELETGPAKVEDWRIGFTYERVQLPLGVEGGRVNAPLPGKMVFRDWYRSKMIVRVDLTTGREEVIVDGALPTTDRGGQLLAYVDPTDAYVVRDLASGKTVHTGRFNAQVVGPQLSPDGTRVVGTVDRRGPDVPAGLVMVAGPSIRSVTVLDLAGREVAVVPDYDDAAWAPDGKLIATGKFNETGLFEIDPGTKQVKPLDGEVAYPRDVSVSPDGRTIAFVSGGKVFLIGRDGNDLRQLFQDGHPQQRPVFSPDGSMVALVVCDQFANDRTGEVFVIDLKTGKPTPLRTSAGTPLMPDPSSRLNWIP